MVRLDVPNRFFKQGFNKGRKQGALEVLQEFLDSQILYKTTPDEIEKGIIKKMNKLKELEK